ncbi:MAG: tyrosine-type recombinase/integrase [bacterium]
MFEILEEYYQHLRVLNYSPVTITGHKSHMKIFCEYLLCRGQNDLLAVTRQDIRELQAYLYERMNSKGRQSKPQTQNYTLRKIGVLYRWLLSEERISADPCKDVVYAKEPHTLPMLPPTTTEARRLLHGTDDESAVGVRDRALLEVAYGSGLRASELRRLKVEDLDLDALTLRVVQGKFRKDRVVPITQVCRDWIRRYLKEARPLLMKGKQDEGFLFVSVMQNKIGTSLPGIIVKRAAKLAGLDKRVYPHALRAACLTHMLRNSKEVGQNILRPLMEMAGHANLGTLHRYTATDIQELKEIHAKTHPRELEADF